MDVFGHPQPGLPDGNEGADRLFENVGGRTFVEPLSVGIPPGETEVGVLGCFWPDESHPMAKPFSWFALSV